MKTVSTEKVPSAIGPYSQAQISGGFVFCSGQIPVIPETGELAQGLDGQAHQVFKNISQLLKAAGSDISKVVKSTVFIRHMDDFAAVNAIYAQYFTGKPARSCVAVKELPKNVLCEVEVIAQLD